MEKFLIIPDVHGRKFWKEPCSEQFDKIIFLGDYLDPYEYYEGITPEDAYNNFLEILEFANNNNNVILLIGNHDWHYFVNLDDCRMDKARGKEIEQLFVKNIDKFRLFYSYGKYVFSHAGITQEWLNDVAEMALYEYSKWNPGDVPPEKDERAKWIEAVSHIDESYDFKLFNNSLQNYNDSFYSSPVSMISRERGGWFPHGSLIWADIREHMYSKGIPSIYQIFGHTLMKKELISKEFACLDCKSAFILNTELNKIVKYDANRL